MLSETGMQTIHITSSSCDQHEIISVTFRLIEGRESKIPHVLVISCSSCDDCHSGRSTDSMRHNCRHWSLLYTTVRDASLTQTVCIAYSFFNWRYVELTLQLSIWHLRLMTFWGSRTIIQKVRETHRSIGQYTYFQWFVKFLSIPSLPTYSKYFL